MWGRGKHQRRCPFVFKSPNSSTVTHSLIAGYVRTARTVSAFAFPIPFSPQGRDDGPVAHHPIAQRLELQLGQECVERPANEKRQNSDAKGGEQAFR